MEKHEIRSEQAPALAPVAVEQLNDHEGALQAAAGQGGGGLRGALQQLIEFGDRRLQAASFFLVWGCCVLINSVVLNPAVNLEHMFAGFVILIIVPGSPSSSSLGAVQGGPPSVQRDF